MIKLYVYDLKRNPDGQPVYAYALATWHDAIQQAHKLYKEEGIRRFEITEKLEDGKFLTAKFKFD